MENAHGRKIAFKPQVVADLAVKRRAAVGAHERGHVVQQAKIRDEVAAQPKNPGNGPVHERRTKRGQRAAADFSLAFFFQRRQIMRRWV